jgi:hypothetical protein
MIVMMNVIVMFFVDSDVDYFAFAEVSVESLTALLVVEDASTVLIVVSPFAVVPVTIVPLELA